MSDEQFDIKEELKKLPASPGVYLMRDRHDEIIYVGKAASLKNRVPQYFQSSRVQRRGPKIEQMVGKISRFEYIVTDSEMEALVLENNLIKEHRPRYNTMLTDDKTYPFIKVTLGEAYPRLVVTRKMSKDKSRYFGPFPSAFAVKETIDLMRKMYKIRTCSRKLPEPAGGERPCLNYHIGQCLAPCQGYVTQEEYRKNLDQAVAFLSGNERPLLKLLEKNMKEAAGKMDYEEAASWRDLLENARQVAQRQKITSGDGQDKDVLAAAIDGEDAIVQVFFIRDGKLIGRDHFWVRCGISQTKGDVLGSFVKQFYSGTPFIPREIFLEEAIEEQEGIEAWLGSRRGNRVYIRVPVRGTKEKLVEMAAQNAQILLKQDRERIRREEGRTIGAVKELEKLLDAGPFTRMEAFDISNISGYESVGSMVVFEKGKPKRTDYRKFRIRNVAGPNDYASMQEVLTRRFTHGLEEQKKLEGSLLESEMGKFSSFPDLILMDGGKGQVNVAQSVLDELGLSIPVCGMVKDDYHRTRGLYFHNVELPIDTHSEGFKLITRIQDEAHRFAIEYHRSLRTKEQVHSVLDDIPGIGPSRRKALMRAFSSIEEICGADMDTLKAVPSMNAASAASVYEFFHNRTEKM